MVPHHLEHEPDPEDQGRDPPLGGELDHVVVEVLVETRQDLGIGAVVVHRLLDHPRPHAEQGPVPDDAQAGVQHVDAGGVAGFRGVEEVAETVLDELRRHQEDGQRQDGHRQQPAGPQQGQRDHDARRQAEPAAPGQGQDQRRPAQDHQARQRPHQPGAPQAVAGEHDGHGAQQEHHLPGEGHVVAHQAVDAEGGPVVREELADGEGRRDPAGRESQPQGRGELAGPVPEQQDRRDEAEQEELLQVEQAQDRVPRQERRQDRPEDERQQGIEDGREPRPGRQAQAGAQGHRRDHRQHQEQLDEGDAEGGGDNGGAQQQDRHGPAGFGREHGLPEAFHPTVVLSGVRHGRAVS